ncbi:hypothetical protein GCM10022288_27270 [Gryllotalpicola kribbensis]|uniref:DUF4383 domain-containing protein n=1 Tax=Gryllotalpicola kribbensis TaxID=993084 RepID=A0ABP8AYK9_9MICO
MSDLARRYGTSSPRTAELPRAFTLGEFVRGAGLALLWFQPLVAISGVIGSLSDGGSDIEYAFVIPVAGLHLSVIATVLGSPAAYAVGFALRRQGRDAAHLAAFVLYGALVGIVMLEAMGIYGQSELPFPWDTTFIYGIPSALAVALGWWTTSRLALRKDRALAAAPRTGTDHR